MFILFIVFQLSQYMLNGSGPTPPPAAGTPPPASLYGGSARYEGFDNNIQQLVHQQGTLRAQYPVPGNATHITLNPYSTQLVDNINRMMNGQPTEPANHIYQVAMSPQLSQLTNTLKKKKNCLGGHPGPCHHKGNTTTDSSVRSDSVAGGEPDTDTEMIPNSADVVFRAVSPHGHVYWEIDPKRPGKLMMENSDSDTNNDMHNMSDFSEEDGSKIAADRSRQSSSRFSDNRPLIASGLSPSHISQLQMAGLLANNQLQHLNQQQQQQPNLIQFSPHRFSSLHRPVHQVDSHPPFSTTRTRGRVPRANPMRGSMEAIQDEPGMMREQVQQQIQIPDLKRMPVSVKSSEYIMAKIQTHMDQRKMNGNTGIGTLREREV